MKCSGSLPSVHSGPHERGSAAYSFLGWAILIVVVIAALLVIPWGDLAPEKENTEFVQANKALAQQQWSQAIELFDKAIAQDPKNVAAFVGRSRAYLNTGNMEKALEDAETAEKLDSDNAMAFAQQAIIAKLNKQFDKALAKLNQVLTRQPANAWALAQKADILMRRSEYEDALANANKALQARPEFVEALRLRARIYTRMGKCKEAYEDFNKVVELQPEDAWTLQDKAWFLLTCPDENVQDTSRAMELAKKAVDMSDGTNGLVYETMAEAYFKVGDPAKAVEYQKKAIEIQRKQCPDGSCVEEMKARLEKYELAARPEKRPDAEILPVDPGSVDQEQKQS
jgi:tetratricopeptide (TPR) repeat protein